MVRVTIKKLFLPINGNLTARLQAVCGAIKSSTHPVFAEAKKQSGKLTTLQLGKSQMMESTPTYEKHKFVFRRKLSLGTSCFRGSKKTKWKVGDLATWEVPDDGKHANVNLRKAQVRLRKKIMFRKKWSIEITDSGKQFRKHAGEVFEYVPQSELQPLVLDTIGAPIRHCRICGLITCNRCLHYTRSTPGSHSIGGIDMCQDCAMYPRERKKKASVGWKARAAAVRDESLKAQIGMTLRSLGCPASARRFFRNY